VLFRSGTRSRTACVARDEARVAWWIASSPFIVAGGDGRTSCHVQSRASKRGGVRPLLPSQKRRVTSRASRHGWRASANTTLQHVRSTHIAVAFLKLAGEKDLSRGVPPCGSLRWRGVFLEVRLVGVRGLPRCAESVPERIRSEWSLGSLHQKSIGVVARRTLQRTSWARMHDVIKASVADLILTVTSFV